MTLNVVVDGRYVRTLHDLERICAVAREHGFADDAAVSLTEADRRISITEEAEAAQ